MKEFRGIEEKGNREYWYIKDSDKEAKMGVNEILEGLKKNKEITLEIDKKFITKEW